jgi:hypothetical protein
MIRPSRDGLFTGYTITKTVNRRNDMEKTRFTVSFTDPNYQWLSQQADSTGQGITEVVNEIIADRRLLKPKIDRLMNVTASAWTTLASLVESNDVVMNKRAVEALRRLTAQL